jgi:hypothetical protein
MSLWRKLGDALSDAFRRRPHEDERRYDNVRVVNVTNGTTISGHDAVKAHFEREKELSNAYGSSIIFQLHRINLQADCIEALQGERLAEFTVDSELVSGSDTVAAVKDKLRSILEREALLPPSERTHPDLTIEETDHITLYFGGRRMQDESKFYADNFVMLPAWVQVLLHRCEFEDVAQRIADLSQGSQERPEH